MVYKVGNVIWAVHGISNQGSAAIRWYELNESTNAVIQQGTISDPNFDYSYPSIAANANGDVVIGFTRAGASADATGPGFLSAFAVVGHTSGGTTTFGTPLLLKAGVANYHLFGGSGDRWGDYSATGVDPTNSQTFWTTQEWAGANNVWETQVTELFVPTGGGAQPGSPPPAPPVVPPVPKPTGPGNPVTSTPTIADIVGLFSKKEILS